jgi:hypothetical protein
MGKLKKTGVDTFKIIVLLDKKKINLANAVVFFD